MPEQARGLRDRFVAEIGIHVLVGQCPDRRIDSLELMRQEVATWQQRRNQLDARINWQFTIQDARGVWFTICFPVLAVSGGRDSPIATPWALGLYCGRPDTAAPRRGRGSLRNGIDRTAHAPRPVGSRVPRK